MGGNPFQVSAAYLYHVAQVESGGNPSARSRISTAGGLFQFTNGTWQGLRKAHPELQLTVDGRFNAAQSIRAMRQFTLNNARFLEARTGKVPGNPELYLAHFLGPMGAVQVLRANPDTLVSAILAPQTIRGNPFLRKMTARGVYSWAKGRIPDYMPHPRLQGNRMFSLDVGQQLLGEINHAFKTGDGTGLGSGLSDNPVQSAGGS